LGWLKAKKSPMHLLKVLLFSTISGLMANAYGQTQSLYNYQDLSHLYYQKQKDSLKKAWVCPVVFKDDKAAQKQYKEFWDSRTESIISSINENDYIHDREVYNYLAGIVQQIASANPQYVPANQLLLIDRSSAANAYSLGDNVLIVNLGMITFARCREDLALTIAHELSHNYLRHFETAIQEKAAWLTSEEYRQSMNSVLSSRYDRLTRLQKILEGYTFSRSRHQRYHESDADSLAIILLKKSSISFNADFFLHLDSSDNEYLQHLRQPLAAYFTPYQLTFDDSWATKRSHGLSTRAYNFSETSAIEDSLKTHPDCPERYARTRDRSSAYPRMTPIPSSVKEKANKMLIWELFTSSKVTPVIYRILLEKDKGNKDPWYDFMLGNCFYSLYYADRQLNRFGAIGIVQKEFISRDCYALQTFLEQVPRDNLRQYCETLSKAAFWNSLSTPEQGLKDLLYTLALDPDDSDHNKTRAAHTFATGNAGSMYCEFADNFEKK